MSQGITVGLEEHSAVYNGPLCSLLSTFSHHGREHASGGDRTDSPQSVLGRMSRAWSDVTTAWRTPLGAATPFDAAVLRAALPLIPLRWNTREAKAKSPYYPVHPVVVRHHRASRCAMCVPLLCPTIDSSQCVHTSVCYGQHTRPLFKTLKHCLTLHARPQQSCLLPSLYAYCAEQYLPVRVSSWTALHSSWERAIYTALTAALLVH